MHRWKKAVALSMIAALAFQSSVFAQEAAQTEAVTESNLVERIVSEMSLDEKISQMIIPAIRMWNGENVTDLDEAEGLGDILRRHQYGGIILYSQNMAGTKQIFELVRDLQANNAMIEDVSCSIPYLMPVDDEGGRVVRFVTGTRMTGNMAIGATGDASEENAEKTGEILGEEIKALGFNADFAPVVDVNNNPANPVIGTRSFSDDEETVTKLGLAYSEGLAKSGIITTYKHFPGHGDTGVDSHTGTPSVEKTYEELQEVELVPFKEAISHGADMIMTAHITYPLIDDPVIFGDGTTQGYYPATMSEKMITEILRGDMGYDGVVVTDGLEMAAMDNSGLVPGEAGSVEYRCNLAKEIINAGTDILLIPVDLQNERTGYFYDSYIADLCMMVMDGTIPAERIDESVTRILKLKEKYGILNQEEIGSPDLDASYAGTSEEEMIETAAKTVGSKAHHEAEMDIARQAITLVKNEGSVVPVTQEAKKVLLLGQTAPDEPGIMYEVFQLQKEGTIPEDAEISYNYYYDPDAEGDAMLHYTEDVKEAVAEADVVIGVSTMFSLSDLSDDSPQYQGLHSAIEDAHLAGKPFILISNNLPYDSARYQDADAIVLSYLYANLGTDPTDKAAGGTDGVAYNANMIAAIDTVFGKNAPSGTLPVNIPVIQKDEDGTLRYGDDILYQRGFGLK